MDDRQTGWRNTPPILLTAFALDLVFTAAHVVSRLVQSGERDYLAVDRWDMASTGMWAAFVVMFCIGMFDLASRLTGGAAIAARVASLAYGAMFATSTLLNVLSVLELLPHGEMIWKVEQYTYWGLGTCVAIALAFAASKRSRAAAVVGFALSMVARMPGFLGEPLFQALDLGPRATEIVYTVLGILHTIAYLVLVIAATDGVEVPRRELATRGFGLAASSLTLRVIAAAAGVVLVVMAVSSRGEGGASLIRFGMIGGLLVNLISFAMFGLGALRAARSALDGIARYTAAVAGAASLWCAGVMLEQLPQFYQVLYHQGHGSSGAERLQALSIAQPLVATLAGALLAAVISGFARARNDEPLTTRAGAAGVGYVLLMLASVGVTSFLLETARSQGMLLGMMLLAAGCGLAAQVMLAKVCRSASASIDVDPGLPGARISAPT